MHRFAFILLIGTLLSSCSSKQPPALSKQEKAELLGPNSSNSIRWHKVAGPDFNVFHGIPKSPASGEVGFYIGGHPSVNPKAGSTRHAGKIGLYEVTWHRKIESNGSIYQTTVFTYGDYYKVHAWVFAKSASELEALTQELGTLRMFSKTPQSCFWAIPRFHAYASAL